MTSFQGYVEEAQKKYKHLPNEDFLLAARNEVYEKMEHDLALKSLILNYYKKNTKNLPFVIT